VLVLVGLSGWAVGWFKATETVVTEIAPGVFFRKMETEPKFLGSNQGWIIFKDFVLVIEASFPTQAEAVIKEIRKTTDKPIRYVFDTHYHGDHADGNPIFEKSQKDNPKEFGHEGLKYAPASLYFPTKLVIDDGTQRVELIHFGHAHTAGDAVAWLPKHGILFTGDACVNGAFNYTGDSNTESWIGVLTKLQELPIKSICPGHGEMTGKDLLATQKRWFVELREAVQMAIDKGKTLDEIKKELNVPFYKDWTGVDAKTRVENIEHVYSELTKRKAG